MTTPSTVEPMSAEQGAALADFARTCKAAARAVALYPEIHPAIQSSLARVVTAAERLTSGGELRLTVLPDLLVLDGRAPARPDASIGELAALLHERLVASLLVQRAATPQDWRALLLLLSRAPEELIAQGGIASVWTASGRGHFEIQEIDYADVLRERDGGGESVDWDQIIANCIKGESLDESQLTLLLEMFSDPARLADFLARLQGTEGRGGASMSERAAALLSLLRQLLEATTDPRDADRVLQAVADGAAKLTPEMLLALMDQARSGDADAQAMSAVISRMSDETVASFVANSVVAEGGASERLAQAFQVLVPETVSRDRILNLAHAEIEGTPLGGDGGFEELWHSAADMLTSYSDQTYVSGEYGRQLSSARAKAVEVERVSDDPPERLRDWKETVSDAALRDLDLSLLLDLLSIEEDADAWRAIADVAAVEVGRRVALGDISAARRLTESIAGVAIAKDHGDRRTTAQSAVATLAEGTLVQDLVAYFRKAPDGEAADDVGFLCAAIGPSLVRPLAESLAAEANPRAIRRLREVLLTFGAPGRQSVDPLKHSSNPAVRRVAVELLRMFGGSDALPELTTLLGDADEHVQRESIRAIIQIGTVDAYAVLERALAAGGPSRDSMLQQLIGLRDDKAAPVLCYVLDHSKPLGGRMAAMHAQIIDALGGLRAHPDSARALKRALYSGEWWAPFRTAALRRAAAAALRRINSPETLAVLHEAATTGSGGVRRAARAQNAGGRSGTRA